MLGCAATPKEPITPTLLLKIHSSLDLSSPLHIVFWAATLTGFFGMLRKSNLFPPHMVVSQNKHLVRSDFVNQKWGLSVNIKWSKTIQYNDRCHVVALPQIPSSPLCPVRALLHMFCKCPVPKKSPAFGFTAVGRYKAMTYGSFVNILKKQLTLVGIDSSKFAAHSLRRGGASWAFSSGTSVELIKLQGDWKSQAYQKYLHLPLSVRAETGKHMAKKILLTT